MPTNSHDDFPSVHSINPSNGPASESAKSVSSQWPSLLTVSGLRKRYFRGGMWSRRARVDALLRADFEIPRAGTLALVGESGSGKSTVARCVTRLERPDAGEIILDGADIARLNARELVPFRSRIQMVFQDAVTSMNPRFSALEVIEEPLLIDRRAKTKRLDHRDVVRALMAEVGISPEWMDRSVFHFSGGQRQRLALARALAVKPELLVLDEALSGLDLSTQAQIANLLLELQTSHALTYLLISHDLALVTRLADVVGVMSAGQIVEVGPTRQLIAQPKHEETRKLVTSANEAGAALMSATGAIA